MSGLLGAALGALSLGGSQRSPSMSITSAAESPGFFFFVRRKAEDGKEGPEADMKVAVRIVEAQKAKDHKKDKLHVNYIISVDTGLPGMSWRVARRFRMFAELDKQLRLVLDSNTKFPPLPKKQLIRSFKPEYVEGKRVELEAYLAELSQLPGVTSSDPWSTFFIGSFEDVFERSAAQQSQQEELGKVTRDLAKHKTLVAELQTQLKRLEQENERMAGSVREKQAVEAQSEQLEGQLRVEQESSKQLRADVEALRKQLEQHQAQAQARVSEVEAALGLANEEKIKALEAAVVAQNEVKTLKAQKRLLVKEVKTQRQQFEAYLNSLASQGIALPPMASLGATAASPQPPGSPQHASGPATDSAAPASASAPAPASEAVPT